MSFSGEEITEKIRHYIGSDQRYVTGVKYTSGIRLIYSHFLDTEDTSDRKRHFDARSQDAGHGNVYPAFLI